MGPILAGIFTLVIAAIVLLIVSRLNLGLKVAGFGPAIIAAIVIAVVTAVVLWLLGLFNITVGNAGFWGALVSLIVAAVVLMLSGKIVPGMEVKGFGGAIIAAIAIAVVNFVVVWFLGLFGIHIA